MPFLDKTGLEHLSGIIKQKYAGKDINGAVVSVGCDYAEYGNWNDGNPNAEDRTGYFITIANGTDNIAIAQSDSAIVGVTTSTAGFTGNYSDGSETNSARGLVGIVGQVSVIDNGTCTVGERCMPNDTGTAEPSSNTCGYKVIERIDDTHVKIMISPALDMIQRIKTDVSSIENTLLNHNHDASDITSGTLGVARGGTGLTASPSMLTNLASKTAANVFADSPRPGVTGTLPIGNGGTGQTTTANFIKAANAWSALTSWVSVSKSAANWATSKTSSRLLSTLSEVMVVWRSTSDTGKYLTSAIVPVATIDTNKRVLYGGGGTLASSGSREAYVRISKNSSGYVLLETGGMLADEEWINHQVALYGR